MVKENPGKEWYKNINQNLKTLYQGSATIWRYKNIAYF